MVRNAGKGEQEKRVWRRRRSLSLLLTGLNEREEGRKPFREKPPASPSLVWSRSKELVELFAAAKCQNQEARGKRKAETFRGICGNNNFCLIEGALAVFIKYVFLRSSSRVRSCSCVREGIIGPPPPPRRRLSLPSLRFPLFRFCMSVTLGKWQAAHSQELVGRRSSRKDLRCSWRKKQRTFKPE